MYDPIEERARKAEEVRATRLRLVDLGGRFCETRHARQYWGGPKAMDPGNVNFA